MNDCTKGDRQVILHIVIAYSQVHDDRQIILYLLDKYHIILQLISYPTFILIYKTILFFNSWMAFTKDPDLNNDFFALIYF